MILSANLVALNKISCFPSLAFPNSFQFQSIPNPHESLKLPPISSSSTSSNSPIAAAAAAAATATPPPSRQSQSNPELSGWADFASRVSGEWDGFGADFTPAGIPIELPESVVPEAYRDWGVQVLDWQTQCPALASLTGDRDLFYKLVKLLPTVGCEADAATPYSLEERVAGGSRNKALALGFDPSGCYVAVWPVREGVMELEHCLVEPGNQEVRMRVVQVVKVEENGEMRLVGIKVFSEQWYGPFRNGEQLGGCAISESGFAATAKVEVSEVVGEWRSKRIAIARFLGGEKDVIHELIEDKPQNLLRDVPGLVGLPKQLWCSLKQKDDGEMLAEVGWLVDRRTAVTSRCVFLQGGKLKEVAAAHEVLEKM